MSAVYTIITHNLLAVEDNIGFLKGLQHIYGFLLFSGSVTLQVLAGITILSRCDAYFLLGTLLHDCSIITIIPYSVLTLHVNYCVEAG